MEYRQTYKELLANVSAVTRNESSDSVNGILDTVSVSEDLRMVSRDAHNAHTLSNPCVFRRNSRKRAVWSTSTRCLHRI